LFAFCSSNDSKSTGREGGRPKRTVEISLGNKTSAVLGSTPQAYEDTDDDGSDIVPTILSENEGDVQEALTAPYRSQPKVGGMEPEIYLIGTVPEIEKDLREDEGLSGVPEDEGLGGVPEPRDGLEKEAKGVKSVLEKEAKGVEIERAGVETVTKPHDGGYSPQVGAAPKETEAEMSEQMTGEDMETNGSEALIGVVRLWLEARLCLRKLQQMEEVTLSWSSRNLHQLEATRLWSSIRLWSWRRLERLWSPTGTIQQIRFVRM
jgi:hypothetical protein